MPSPVAVVGTPLDIVGGVSSTNAQTPIGMIVSPAAATVLAGGIPVATVGTDTSIHGNPFNPQAPGYNPACACSLVVNGSSTVLVEGRPIAVAGPSGSLTMCGHWVAGPGIPTVLVGGPLGG